MKVRVINSETGRAEYLDYDELMEFRGFGKPKTEIVPTVKQEPVLRGQVIMPAKNNQTKKPQKQQADNSTHAALKQAFANQAVQKPRGLARLFSRRPTSGRKSGDDPTDPTMFEPG